MLQTTTLFTVRVVEGNGYGAMVRASLESRWVDSCSRFFCHLAASGKLFTHVFLCHQAVAYTYTCNLVQNSAKGQRCYAAGKVAAGIAESKK